MIRKRTYRPLSRASILGVAEGADHDRVLELAGGRLNGAGTPPLQPTSPPSPREAFRGGRALPILRLARDQLASLVPDERQRDVVGRGLQETVSAGTAPRWPSGFGAPLVVSRPVCVSISALICAPSSSTVADSHIQVMKPMIAPSEP